MLLSSPFLTSAEIVNLGLMGAGHVQGGDEGMVQLLGCGGHRGSLVWTVTSSEELPSSTSPLLLPPKSPDHILQPHWSLCRSWN